MSKYYSNMIALDKEFKEARTEFELRLERAQDAKEYVQELKAKNAKGADAEAKLLRAQADSREAEAAVNAIWDKFRTKAADTLGTIRKDIEQTGVARAEDLDGNALTLLESGIMTAVDYEYMAEQYKDNRTMLRMISRYAHDAAEKAENQQTKAPLLNLVSRIKTIDEEKLEALGVLEKMVNVCTGTGMHGTDKVPIELIATKAARWEELTKAAIAVF